MPHVMLLRPKTIRVHGVTRTYHAGDAVEVGRATAIEWVLEGSAKDTFEQLVDLDYGDNKESCKFGVRILGEPGSAPLELLGGLSDRVPISYGTPEIPYEHTFIWTPDLRVTISENVIEHGFVRVLDEDSWEMAARLIGPATLATAVGSEEDRKKTLEVIGTLELGVYESRMVWARQCKSAKKVISAWAEEISEGAGIFHSFLRALYTQQALMCTLPFDWLRR